MNFFLFLQPDVSHWDVASTYTACPLLSSLLQAVLLTEGEATIFSVSSLWAVWVLGTRAAWMMGVPWFSGHLFLF